MNITLLSNLTTRLSPISDTPALDASVLLAHVLNRPRTWVMAHPEVPLTVEQKIRLEAALARLKRGESFPYILGHWEFFGLDLEVNPDVLIPRPETELLVEKAIAWLQVIKERRMVADVGTGSGCIAISLALNVPNVHIVATDISYTAIKVARRNAKKYHVLEAIDFIQCDLLPPHSDSLPGESRFDLICANLPYIPTETLKGLPVYKREPTLALNGGLDGLDLFRKLLQIAPQWLASGGVMLAEIEATLGVKALGLAYDAFSEAEIRLHRDLTGRERLLEIQLLT
jgi:release factor glutamine methyltransferase